MRSEASSDLIARARHDRAAFGELYDHYLPRVYAFCRRYSRNREEAEDFTALTFERALSAINRYENRELPFSRWLLTISANAITDQARRRGPSGRSVVDLGQLPDESQLDQWVEAYWLRAYIEALPSDQREVVHLRFYEDQPFRDVALRMGRSEGTVKQLLRRALRALHVRMQEEETHG